jgi:nitroreductase
MDVSLALRTRSSTRAFSPRALPDDLLEAMLLDAREAPSWSNTQPWKVAVANGADCDNMREALLHAAQTRVPAPDVPQLFTYPPLLQERRRATGFGLYEVLGIEREDREGRARQFQKNFAFFDAPCVLFLFAHRALESYAMLDCGCFLQSLLLSATARGVQTCAQAVLASFPDLVRAQFDVDEEWALVCGVALGYANDAPENAYRPARASLAELVARPR